MQVARRCAPLYVADTGSSRPLQRKFKLPGSGLQSRDELATDSRVICSPDAGLVRRDLELEFLTELFYSNSILPVIFFVLVKISVFIRKLLRDRAIFPTNWISCAELAKL